jgi:ribosomal protein S18 acetylase RimI-like enzyme
MTDGDVEPSSGTTTAGRVDARRGAYAISDDPARLDLDAVHAYLARSYWARGIPRQVLQRAAANSLCFGVRHRDGESESQVGFARVITDRATFAYLADVYILEEHRGQGLATWLVEVILAHPELQGLRRFMLVTRDAQKLYARVGFRPAAASDNVMQIRWPNVYGAPPDAIGE